MVNFYIYLVEFLRLNRELKGFTKFTSEEFEKNTELKTLLKIGSEHKNALDQLIFYASMVYVGIFVPFATLAGTTVTRSLKTKLVLLSTYAFFQDKLTDEVMDPKHRDELSILLKGLKGKLMTDLSNVGRFEIYLARVLNAQKLSKQQKSGDLSLCQLKEITADKCGYSFLLTRSLIDEPISKSEEQFIYQYGYFSQVGDDILDYYDDRRNGLQTIPQAIPTNDLKVFFADLRQYVIQLLLNNKYPTSNKFACLKRIKVMSAIFELGLDKLETASNQAVEGRASKFVRTNFIVDMDNWGNKVRVFVKCL